ncbi:SCO family protein [Pseudomonas sp. TCU-HL1]|uniref:SCO family protein n=1 Tax=Pseudomonas sp. TCU-HL1 TaxID=1856685 RepID=UPI00083D70BD|nr:SCO family protein [Pseudomonas sp. TCU-HL1]AOE88216.1 electron transporter SenC [Pseudomonas sp. TCU-HL1]
MNTRRNLLVGMGAAALGVAAWSGASEEPQRARRGAADGGYFPNTSLYTHEGQAVRFYDELIRGKVVAINMMYTSCTGICPTTTANLRLVQQLLGKRVGRDVFMYSISLQSELDTPQILKAYVERHHIEPGWWFLTGAPADIEQLRFSLGFYSPDPLVDGNKANHSGILRIGNDAYQRWTMAPALAEPEQILATINHVDRAVVLTVY